MVRKTTAMLFRMLAIEELGRRTGQNYRQVFVTQSATLANKVQSDFRRMIGDDVTDPEEQDSGTFTLHDVDNEAGENASLPKSWAALKDSDFPLFLTCNQVNEPAFKFLQQLKYLQLYRLLEVAVGLGGFVRPGFSTRKRDISPPFITFKYFETNLWPHLNHGLKKGLSELLCHPSRSGQPNEFCRCNVRLQRDPRNDQGL
jgi:hypothetical protein